MRSRALLVSLATLAVLATGCGTQTQQADRGSAASPAQSSDHSSMKMDGMDGMEMEGMDTGAAAGPSESASMVCGPEIVDAVERLFMMSSRPDPTSSWSASDRLFSCTYRVPRGTVRMTVQDATVQKEGRAYFADLRASLPGAKRLTGVESFGFPSFETPDGDVVFLKDGKTLHVDASSLPSGALPAGYTRPEAAYSIASSVIACWTE